MKAFFCTCGQRIFFDNRVCTVCGRTLGFDPGQLELIALEIEEDEVYSADSARFRRCANDVYHNACNWLIEEFDLNDYCLACRLNELIPDIGDPRRKGFWLELEAAKRRLLYTLLQLGLAVVSKNVDPVFGLSFAFIEDRRSNPDAAHEFILTGHQDGLITINLAEADPALREAARAQLGERYRTPLGHLRHESGHYYWPQLVSETNLAEFRQLFGDESRGYEAALKDYYAREKSSGWQQEYISAYAQAHPLEDWAESWAHYLHMVDTLETAQAFGILPVSVSLGDLDDWLPKWIEVSVVLNELNRSMGLADAYPFVLTPAVITKLRFVHRMIDPRQTPRQ